MIERTDAVRPCGADSKPTNADDDSDDPEFPDWGRFVEYDQSRVRTHRDQRALKYLYVDCGLTTREVAEYFDVSHATISRQLRANDVETRATAPERSCARDDDADDKDENVGDRGDCRP